MDTAPSSQSLARLSVLVLRPTRHLHSAHTPQLCTDLLKDGKKLATWGLCIHTGTDYRHLRNPLFPLPALSSGVTMTGPPVTKASPTHSCPEGEPPSSPPSPTGGEGMRSCPERAPRGGQAWTGLLGATSCCLR